MVDGVCHAGEHDHIKVSLAKSIDGSHSITRPRDWKRAPLLMKVVALHPRFVRSGVSVCCVVVLLSCNQQHYLYINNK